MREIEVPQHEEIAETAKLALSRLIDEQGVTPVHDLDQLAGLWPADDDPDALMKFVLLERQARGQLPEDQQSK